MPDPQAEILSALESGGAVGADAPLRRIDTHMSHVFLGAERVYKLKRDVRLPFVDFSTLERRRAACEAELEINRRFAPGLYLGVSPVVRSPSGRIAVGGAGEVLDWVVVMRRFADEDLLDRMAEAGRLAPDLAAEAAERVARFHVIAEPAPGAGRPQDYAGIVAGLRRTEAHGAAAHGLEIPPPALCDALDAEIARRAALIERRRGEGRVRRGHGDLHLGNMCMFEGVPTPFDALEFDPALASADVLYDLAFLLMDLRWRGLPAQACAAMNRYWDVSGEPEEALALLPLFMALRAQVRAAVAMEAGRPDESGRRRALGLALLAAPAPRLVAIGGLSGSGKSAVARALAGALGGPCGARLLRTDVLRKTALGRTPSDRLGPEAYRPGRRAKVYESLAGRAAEALGAGSPVIADATFRDPAARAAIVQAGRGARLDAIWLSAPIEVRLERVRARRGDASDAGAEVARAQAEPALEPGWTAIDAAGPLEEVVRRAGRVLGLATPQA